MTEPRAPASTWRFALPCALALVGTALALVLSFEAPHTVLSDSWKWVACALGVLACMLAGRGLYRELLMTTTEGPVFLWLALLALSICLVLQAWIPALRLVAFAIAFLVFLGVANT